MGILLNLMEQYGRENIPFLFLIDYEKEKPFVIRLEEARAEGIFFSIPGFSNCAQPKFKNLENLVYAKKPVSYPLFLEKFNLLQKELEAGHTYLANLTFPCPMEMNFSISEIFPYTKAKYKLIFKNEFIVFSPETFIRIQDKRISTFPVKGTGISEAELLNNDKESAEHITVVDLLRNDLGIVAKKIHVDRYRAVEKIQSGRVDLFQTASTISGQLRDGWHRNLADIIFPMLPAGSVTGAPKKKTVEVLKNIESEKRGYYTGIFGIYRDFTLDSAVLIRYIENTPNGPVYRSGCGITVYSDPELEYRELVEKVYIPI